MTILMIRYFLTTTVGTREGKIWNGSCLALALKELADSVESSRELRRWDRGRRAEVGTHQPADPSLVVCVIVWMDNC